MKKIQPQQDRILITYIDDDAESDGGILIPEAHRAKGTIAHGRVVAIGKGRRDEKTGRRIPITDMDVGDVVAYKRGFSIDVEQDDELFGIVPADMVIGVVE